MKIHKIIKQKINKDQFKKRKDEEAKDKTELTLIITNVFNEIKIAARHFYMHGGFKVSNLRNEKFHMFYLYIYISSCR